MIYFISSNPLKINEAQQFFDLAGISVVPKKLDIVEIQNTNQKVVAKAKARAAYIDLKAPLFVDDAGIFIPRLNNFPGTTTSIVSNSIGVSGVCKLINNEEKAVFKATVTYIDEDTLITCQGEVSGQLKKDSLKHDTKYFSDIFFPDDGRGQDLTTLMSTSYLSHRKKALRTLASKLHARGLS